MPVFFFSCVSSESMKTGPNKTATMDLKRTLSKSLSKKEKTNKAALLSLPTQTLNENNSFFFTVPYYTNALH